MTQKTYDDIVRSTVPELDSSMRPTRAQVQQSREGFRAMDDAEQALYARISEATLVGGVAMGSVQLEVARDAVTLHGNVADAAAIDRVEALVREVDGVGSVVNRLVVLARP